VTQAALRSPPRKLRIAGKAMTPTPRADKLIANLRIDAYAGQTASSGEATVNTPTVAT
jgi:hypothetical protein